MTTGRHFSDDRRMRGADQMFRREDLFTGRDVVCLAGEQVERDLDVLSATVFAQPDEFTLGETIRLEQFLDRLQIVAAGQIDGSRTIARKCSLRATQHLSAMCS
jgi:hypothetical protein